MAENKKSFILYCDFITVFEQLSEREAGQLIRHIFRYVNDQNPEAVSRIITMAFEPIKLHLKRDLKKYESIREKRKESGKKGGRGNKANKANAFFAKQTKANKAVNDNVNVNVNGIVRENTPPLEFKIEECLEFAMADDRWVRSNKTTKNELIEFNKLLERRGIYEKNPKDYKEHFANWKLSGKKESFFDNTGPVQDFNIPVKNRL